MLGQAQENYISVNSYMVYNKHLNNDRKIDKVMLSNVHEYDICVYSKFSRCNNILANDIDYYHIYKSQKSIYHH